MNSELAVVLGLLVAAIVMFAVNRPRMDAVAVLMLVALPLTGIISVGESLAGFADPNIVLIAALFVIGEGLVRTGVARRIGDWIAATTGKSETKLLVLLMIAVCGLGSMMSSTAVTAIFIPIALRIAQSTGAAPGQLMMPISFAALISGMMTLVATAPNLVVSSELERQGAAGFSFFAFTPFGVPILILGVVYMLFARRWLPKGDPAASGGGRRGPSLATWVAEFKLADREHRMRVAPGSPLIGKTLGSLELRGAAGVNVLAVERTVGYASTLVQPNGHTELLAGDILLIDVSSPQPGIEGIASRYGLEALPLSGNYFTDRSQDMGMAELIVPADSDLIGKTVVESEFRSRSGLTVIGLRRGREALADCVLAEKLRVGDTLLAVGPWKRIGRLEPDESGVVVLRMPIEVQDVLPAPGKAIHAVACLLLVIGLMVSGVVPNVIAALIGCLLMGALGCIDFASAYRSIGWKTLVLIVGMLPFSIALQRTGGVELAAKGLAAATDGAGLYTVLAALFAITAALGMFISNTATAVLMAPVAIAVARDLGCSPYPFAMIVALAASTAFITPVSSPVNTLVVTPGNYSFGDFVKIGAPFALIVLVISVLMVPLVFPF
jgi:di/tricarboxylate transporter